MYHSTMLNGRDLWREARFAAGRKIALQATASGRPVHRFCETSQGRTGHDLGGTDTYYDVATAQVQEVHFDESLHAAPSHLASLPSEVLQ